MRKTPNYNPAEHTPRLEDAFMTRREALQRTGMGMGALSLAWLLGQTTTARANAVTILSPLAPKQPQFPTKAKHVIHIFAGGGPSHVDTWDPKPALSKYADQTLPGLNGLAYPSPFEFKKMGKSGVEVSELFPQLGACVDDMCVIRSMWTDVPAHEPASKFMHTGSLQIPKPSLGSWLVYGLGTENQNMPGFISLGGKPEYRQASFLPSLYQGVNVNYSTKLPLNQVLLNIHNQFTSSDDQRLQLDLARRLNTMHAEKLHKEEQLEARIESFEMAFRMQTEATDAFDIMKESPEMRQAYGNTEFGAKLLVARRLVERGVRFVQVFTGGWDHHANLEVSLRKKATEIDQPAATLIADLKKRGLLDDTLIIWGGEFGRTPMGQGTGRDHHILAFSLWLAGGGIKPGITYGATDELGYKSVDKVVTMHDLHATMLRLCGIDHERFSVKFQGLDARLSGVEPARIVKDILA